MPCFIVERSAWAEPVSRQPVHHYGNRLTNNSVVLTSLLLKNHKNAENEFENDDYDIMTVIEWLVKLRNSLRLCNNNEERSKFIFTALPAEPRRAVADEEVPQFGVAPLHLPTLASVTTRVGPPTGVFPVSTATTFEPREAAALVGRFSAVWVCHSGAGCIVQTWR